MGHSSTPERAMKNTTRHRDAVNNDRNNLRRRHTQRNTRALSRKSKNPRAVTDLPNDVIVEILAHAAASSMHDLVSLKMSCKTFDELSREGYVYKHASLENIEVLPRNHASIIFFDRCISNGNPEALFRRGMVEFFRCKTMDAGLEYLKAAVDGGHYGASYLLGVMSAISGEKERVEQGVRLLNRVHVIGKVKECREKLTEAKDQFIWNSRDGWFMAIEKPTLCPKQHWKKSGWSYDYEHFEDETCRACKCDVEISYFYGRFCEAS